VRPRDYGQTCGLAFALELVGERWALLVVRDLILGPKRFTDLRRGLPRIPTNVLSARLKELERGGVVRRSLSPVPGGPVVYELTDYGKELEEIVLRLGMWGARMMGEPRPGDTLNPDSLQLALRAMFQPDQAAGPPARYVLRAGEAVVNVTVGADGLEVGGGPLNDPDLEIETDPAGLHALLSGRLSPSAAVKGGTVRIAGDPSLLERFAAAFSLETVVPAEAAT
jgi:DNA-binding HxlR family transcriptional regulator